MASITAKLDRYKVDATFHGDTVVHTTGVERGTPIAARETTWKRMGILGAGGFGVVWREKEEESEQLRAVKVIPRMGLNIRELKALVEVQEHPRLFIQFLCWFEDPHAIYIAMEYIAYGDLEQYLNENGTKAAAEAKEIMSQILKGLVVLHGRGICHRDLKPKNILIASPSPIWVKITDFGISKQTRDTSLRTAAGTICYQAPEQLGLLPNEMKVRTSYTKAVDIWALGTVLHVILTSEIPFLDSYEPIDSMTTTPDSATNHSSAMSTIVPSTDTSTTIATIDYELLYSYCRGSNFPTESLRSNGVSDDGIDFVKRLMVADPRKRISANDALKNQWVMESPFECLRRQFERLSVHFTPESASQLLVEEDRATIIELLGSPFPREIWTMQCTAVSIGVLEAVKVLLKLLDNVDSIPRPECASLLQLAVMNGQIGAMKLLFNRDADPDESGTGQTPLHLAAGRGNIDAMNLLLAKGATIEMVSKTNDGQLPLHAAAAGGHFEAIELLLDRGAIVHAWARSENGQLALHGAAAGGHLEAMRLLLDRGADVNGWAGTKNGQTALHAAAGGHLKAIVLLLERGADVNGWAGNKNGQTALHAAAVGGNLGAIGHLLGKGADVNGWGGTKNGQTALHAAAAGGHLDAIGFLLGKGADVNGWAGTKNGQTALHAAAASGHLGTIELLLGKGADVNGWAGNINGQTALHAAAAGGHLEAIGCFLDMGADVNGWAGTENGQTALQAAAGGGQLGTIGLLLGKGADVNGWAGNKNGQLALHAAAAGGHLEAIGCILDKGADVNGWAGTENGQTALHAAAAGGHLGTIGLLLDRGADANGWAGNKNGQTALHAAAGRHVRAIVLLLDKGADVNGWAGTENGQTALHQAAAGGHLGTIGLLLDRGANTNGRDGTKNGQTALHAATVPGHLEAVRLLQDRGATLSVQST